MIKKLYTKTPELFDAEGHLNDEGIALYVDALILSRLNQLPPEVIDHLEECMKCKHEVTELHSIQKEVNYANLGPHPYFDHLKPRNNWNYLWRVAAVVLVTSGLCYLVFSKLKDGDYQAINKSQVRDSLEIQQKENVASDHKKENQSAEKIQQVKEPGSKNLLAYTPSPVLEDLIQTNTRSSDIKILSPYNNDTLKGSIKFQWEFKSDEKLWLKIVDNSEKELYNYSVQEDQFVLQERLKPGLYYWKLETQDDLVHVGKFFVK